MSYHARTATNWLLRRTSWPVCLPLWLAAMFLAGRHNPAVAQPPKSRSESSVQRQAASKPEPERWRGPQPPEGKPWPTHAHFFQRYWFQMGDEFFNPAVNNRFRVNDPYAATHPNFHARCEPKGNGMMLIPLLEPLREIEAARLYLELWGGHPHTDHRRVTMNGRTTYPIDVPSDEQCTHAYRSIPLKLTDLVQGLNALQFAVDGDHTFWGHFIVDEAALDALLPPSDSRLVSLGAFATRPPRIQVVDTGREAWDVSLPMESDLARRVQSVHYFAKYDGFDENGDGQNQDWHGMTKHKVPVGHVGSSAAAPFAINWNTSMLRAQTDVRVMALVEFQPDAEERAREESLQQLQHRFWKAKTLLLQTDASEPLSITHPGGIEVAYLPARNLSVPFWSRAGRERICEFELDVAPDRIQRAILSTCVWDGGAGSVKDYFQLNGHFLPIARSGAHDTIHTVLDVPPAWLRSKTNRATLRSDTEHHGIEVLYPGPMLTIRYDTTGTP